MPDDALRADRAGALVTLSGVSRRNGLIQVLHQIDLELFRGEVVVLLGPDGAGKSTLCRAVNGSERIDAGAVTVEGRPLPRRRRGFPAARGSARSGADRFGIGLVPQQPELLAHRTVLENVTLGRTWFGGLGALPVRIPDPERRGLAMLERVGVARCAARFPHELSENQRQRVAIARTLAADPGLLVLDEPGTAENGPEPGRPLPDLLRDLAADGLGLLVATGDPALARATADRVVFMDGGRIIEQGPPDEFFSMPRTARARDFLAGAVPR